ncbi:MAG: hypothetical protein F6K47_23285 [Symploca sp. SIO2E6]|nr:hypothetical protein [Symploca sp. SIO2E6]
MLNLAQVKKNKHAGELELRLLARQTSETSWELIDPENVPLTPTHPSLLEPGAIDSGISQSAIATNEGLLVLVDLSEDQEILNLQPAQDWVLNLVEQYLSTGVTPTFLREEAERTEQWRQDLTLQSQDLTRQRLEMEARRERIETLEEELKQKEKELEEKAKKLDNQTESDSDELD